MTRNIGRDACLLLVLTAGLTHGMEQVKNGDFENGKTEPWHFSKASKNANLSIIHDSGSPCGGSKALGITLSGEERRVDLHQNVKIGPGMYNLSAWIDTTRCTKPGGFIMLYLSGTVNGKWHNFGGVATRGTVRPGWKKTVWGKFEKVIKVPDGGMVRSINVALVNNLTGTIMLDGISIRNYSKEDERKDRERKQLEEKQTAERKEQQKFMPQGTLSSRKSYNLFRLEDTPELGFELKNPTDRETAVQVRFTTTDYFGKTVLKTEKEFKIPAKGKISEVILYPECSQPGFYCTNAVWKCGKTTGQAQASFVKVGPIPTETDPLFGISFYCDKSNASIKRLSLLAAGSAGIDFNWPLWVNAKPEKLEKLKELLATFRKYGIEPIGGFEMHYGAWKQDAWKRWMPKGKVPEGQKEPSIQDLKDVLVPFIEKMVTLCKPYIKTWFLGGEVDCGGQNYPGAIPAYIGMINFTYPAIKKADPDAVIAGPGTSGARDYPPFPWLRKLLPEFKNSLDGFALDTYTAGQRYGKGFMNLNSEEAALRSIMLNVWSLAKKNNIKFISIAEKGPSIARATPLDSPLGISMANIAARDYILLKTVPQVRHWLYFRPDNWNPKTKIDFGMWEKGNPRQVVSAYAATARIMAFAEFVKELKLHQDIPCWIFRKDGKYFAAIWYNGKEKMKVRLADGIPAEAKDVQGNPIDLKDRTIDLGEAPIYLYAQGTAALEKLLKNAAADVPELAFDVDRQNAGKAILIVKNLSGHKIELELKKAGIPGGQAIQYADRFPLASGEVRTIEKPIGSDSVTFHLETGKGRKYTVSGNLKTVKVPFVNSFAELKRKAVPQLLNDPVRQIPRYEDLIQHGVYSGLDDLSAVFRLGYDKHYLYLEVQVKDDIHLNNSVRVFRGDSIQFAIDANRDAKMKRMRGIKGYSGDDFNFVSALANANPCTQCYIASKEVHDTLWGKNYRLKPEITRNEKTKETLYQVKLAFSDLRPLKPERGRVFGFSLILFDMDSPLSYHSMEYSEGISGPKDPAKYPAFQFE